MKKIKWIALCLALVQLLLLFAACGGEETKTTGNKPAAQTTGQKPAETPTTQNKEDSSTTGAPATTEPDLEEEDPYLYIVVDGEAQYTIVGSVVATNEETDKIREMIETLTEMTGASFRLENDMEEPSTDCEILIRSYRNREDVKALYREMSYTEFRADVVGNRVVLATYADYLDRLLNYLVSSIYELEEGTWVIDRYEFAFTSDSITSSRAIPHYDTLYGVLQGGEVYMSGHGGYTVSIEKTTPEEFAAYQEFLQGKGYTKYSENKIGLVDFAVYVNGEKTLYLQFNTSDVIKGNVARITLTIGETLPSTTAEPYENLVEPTIIQPQVDGHIPYNNGMFTMFQLSDGSFIIADGSMYTAKDITWLISYLKENTPAGRTPTIALWLWTHAHGDHVDLPRKAMADLKNAGIQLEAFGHHFPDWKVVADQIGGSAEYYSDELVATTKAFFPDAMEWVMHAGQKMYVADAVVECIWSQEDVHPMAFSTLNDTDTVFSVTIDGIKTMVLGDCQNPNSKMISWYKEALRSHVVQNSHHSINGPKKMYEYIDPIYSLWACPDATMESNQTDHGQYLKTTQWTRTDENGNTVTGDRHHYTNSRLEVIYIKDIKAAYGNLK